MIQDLHASIFTPRLGETFHFRNVENSISADLTLADVSEKDIQAHTPGGARTHCIRLFFKGSLDSNLPQGIYRLANDVFGETELFVVPMQPDAEHAYYEIVINRLIT